MAWLKKHGCTACSSKSEHWRQKQWPSVAERVEVRGIVEDMIANGLDGAFDLLGFELPLQECSCQGEPLETPLAAGRACKLPAASPCAPPVRQRWGMSMSRGPPAGKKISRPCPQDLLPGKKLWEPFPKIWKRYENDIPTCPENLGLRFFSCGLVLGTSSPEIFFKVMSQGLPDGALVVHQWTLLGWLVCHSFVSRAAGRARLLRSTALCFCFMASFKSRT